LKSSIGTETLMIAMGTTLSIRRAWMRGSMLCTYGSWRQKRSILSTSNSTLVE
jgi:hypothetical protein